MKTVVSNRIILFFIALDLQKRLQDFYGTVMQENASVGLVRP